MLLLTFHVFLSHTTRIDLLPSTTTPLRYIIIYYVHACIAYSVLHTCFMCVCACFKELVQEAIECSLKAREEWENTPFEHRYPLHWV